MTDPAAPDRRLPVRTIDLAFTALDIPYTATLRVDAPSAVVDDFFGTEPAGLKRALEALVLAWDVLDEQGEPMPLPKDGGIGRTPYPVLNGLAVAYIEALARPKAGGPSA